MIKFFRNIRRRLLRESKFSKYLLYAIGETILVMVGILLALQVNNWNEENKQRAKEVELINAVILDLDLKLKENTSDLEIGNRIIERCTKINRQIEAGLLIDTADVKDILEGLGSDEWYFVTDSPTYQSIVTSGLWQRLPDTLARMLQSIYVGNAEALNLGFQKHNEYATQCKIDYLAPNALLDLNQEPALLSQKINKVADEFQIQLSLYVNGVRRMIRLNSHSINSINKTVAKLNRYRDQLSNNRVK